MLGRSSFCRLLSSRKAASIGCAVLLLAALFSGGSARAQTSIGCGIDNLTRTNIAAAKTASDEGRISIARGFIDNWQVSLPTLMAELKTMQRTDATQWETTERRQMVFLTGVVKTILASKSQAIQLFRQCDSDQIIKPLVWAARGNDTDLRLNTANILANTVDNTTVCFVLHHLRDSTISDNGRANLLGITRAVASYAYEDNVTAINQTLDIVRRNLGDNISRMQQTAQLLNDIRARTARSSNQGAPLSGNLAQYCKDYPYDAPLSRTD